MSDYFDRLLTRHAPAAAAAGGVPGGPDGPRADRTVRVRPRLPGPYERVESLRDVAAGAARPDGPAPLFTPAPRPGVLRERQVRYEREVRTEHRTAMRSEPAPRGDGPARPAAAAPAVPLLRPGGRISPAPRPAAPEARRTGRQAPARAAADEHPLPAVAAPVPPGTVTAPPSAVAALRPGTAGASAAREAARAAGGRRRSRGGERTVHVQIGRLEVSAAGPPGGGRTAPGRQEPAGRPAPALSLADYLAGGERRG